MKPELLFSGLETLPIPLLMVLTRLSGVLVALPVLSGFATPTRVRLVYLLALAIVMTLALPKVEVPSLWSLALVTEFLLGMAMGMVVRMVMVACEFAGEVVSQQLGFGFAGIVDPMLNEPTGPITRLITLVSALLFFVTDAYRDILKALAASFRVVPPGMFRGMEGIVATVVDAGADMFHIGLRLAAPLVGITFAVQLSFAILGRVAPQLNLWAVGFLGTIGVGLLSLTFFAPSLIAEIQHTLRDSLTSLHGLLTAL